MSLFSTETFRLHAESIGVSNLKDEVLSLLCHDTEYRVREVIQEAAKFMRHAKRQKLMIEDINHALKLKHVDPIYGYDPSEPQVFKSISPGTVYYLSDRDIDFDAILTSPLPKIPQPVKFTTHWLAIEGFQPQIPENIVARDLRLEPHDDKRAGETEIEISGSRFNVKHHLSKEHQMYFDTVTSCLLSKDPTSVTTALNSLGTDAGIQQLLPYFVQFASEMVMKHLRNLPVLKLLLQTVKALLSNAHLFIEPYLHQLMPTLLTCIVGKRLSDTVEEDHWSLREDSSKIIGAICQKYGDSYPTLQPRVMKTLMKALMSDKKSFSSKYGALYCMLVLGPESVGLFIIPNIEPLSRTILSCESRSAMEKEKCLSMLLKVVGTFLGDKYSQFKYQKTGTDTLEYLEATYNACFEVFGDRLLPFLPIEEHDLASKQ